jgi:hypothetical protein
MTVRELSKQLSCDGQRGNPIRVYGPQLPPDYDLNSDSGYVGQNNDPDNFAERGRSVIEYVQRRQHGAVISWVPENLQCAIVELIARTYLYDRERNIWTGPNERQISLDMQNFEDLLASLTRNEHLTVLCFLNCAEKTNSGLGGGSSGGDGSSGGGRDDDGSTNGGTNDGSGSGPNSEGHGSLGGGGNTNGGTNDGAGSGPNSEGHGSSGGGGNDDGSTNGGGDGTEHTNVDGECKGAWVWRSVARGLHYPQLPLIFLAKSMMLSELLSQLTALYAYYNGRGKQQSGDLAFVAIIIGMLTGHIPTSWLYTAPGLEFLAPIGPLIGLLECPYEEAAHSTG